MTLLGMERIETGNDVERRTYFYVIDLGDEYDKIKGTVSIIR